jgi:hypothetical protein
LKVEGRRTEKWGERASVEALNLNRIEVIALSKSLAVYYHVTA